MALLCVALAAGCVCPPRAQQLLATGFTTPRQAFESFQTFLAADLPDHEYRCFSAGFRERNGLSLLSYGEGRDEFLTSHPWMRYVAEAEIVGERALSAGVHVVEARIAGRTLHVRMLREDSYEISAGDALLADGFCNWTEVVDVGSSPRPHLRAAVTPEPRWIYGELAEATRIVVERSWRIDDLREVESAGDSPSP